MVNAINLLFFQSSYIIFQKSYPFPPFVAKCTTHCLHALGALILPRTRHGQAVFVRVTQQRRFNGSCGTRCKVWREQYGSWCHTRSQGSLEGTPPGARMRSSTRRKTGDEAQRRLAGRDEHGGCVAAVATAWRPARPRRAAGASTPPRRPPRDDRSRARETSPGASDAAGRTETEPASRKEQTDSTGFGKKPLFVNVFTPRYVAAATVEVG